MALGTVTSLSTQNIFFDATTPSRNHNQTTATFMMLHFRVSSNLPLAANEKLVIPLNNGQTDTISRVDGVEFWSRPIKGNSTSITLSSTSGAITSRVQLIDVAVGNKDIFAHNLVNYTLPADPNHQDYDGFNENAGIKWEEITTNVAPADSDLRRVANCVGLYVYIRPSNTVAGTRVIGNGTAVLMDGQILITAGHTVFNDSGGTFDEALSGSFSPNYEQTINGDVKFYKVDKVEKHGYQYAAADPLTFLDYVALKLKPTTPDILTSLATLPAATLLTGGQQVFIVHHPDGLTKKISRPNGVTHPSRIYFPIEPHPAGLQPFDSYWFYNSDAVGGSSGSAVFALTGPNANRIAGLLVNIQTPWTEAPGVQDSYNWGPRINRIIAHFQNPLAVDQQMKIAVVVDTSYSMASLSGNPNVNTTKLQEAKSAVALFFSLLRVNPIPGTTLPDNGRHHAALVEFSTDATTPQPLALLDSVLRSNLISTRVPGLQLGGSTSIGDGLQAALTALNPPAIQKISNILLMTDGMENTTLMIADVQAALQASGARLNIIGFGQSGDVNHQQMSQLAFANKGVYSHAFDGLELKKYYALIYSDVFESGSPIDPTLTIPARVTDADPVDFSIWSDTSLTVVVGWDRPETRMRLKLISPSGQEILEGQPDVTVTYGDTWMHMRLELPYNGEQNGTWKALVQRVGSDPLRLRAHDAPVTSVTYSPRTENEMFLAASGAANSTVFLWDVMGARAIRGFYLENPDPEMPGVAALAFSRNADLLFVAYAGQPLVVWETNTGDQLADYSNSDLGRLTCLDISPEGNWLALGGIQGVDILSLAGTQPVLLFSIVRAGVTSVGFSPNNQWLAVGGAGDGFLFIFDIGEDGVELMQFEAPEPVTSVDFSPDGQTLLAGHPSGLMSIYSVNSSVLEQSFQEHQTPITAVTFAPSGEYALSSALSSGSDQDEPLILLWDTAKWSPIASFKGHTVSVLMVAFSPGGNQALSASADTTLMPWQVPDGVPMLNGLDFAERFFVNNSAISPIFMSPYFNGTAWYYYTGDIYYPQVILRQRSGAQVLPAEMQLEITAPLESPGNLLRDQEQSDTRPASAILGDPLSPRVAALRQLQQRLTEPLIDRATKSYKLFDDARHYDGAMLPDGLYGNRLPDTLLHEGHYTLRATARYGDNLQGMREVTWSIYVNIGIDPNQTGFNVGTPTQRSDGRSEFTVEITPRDRYGNAMGLGYSDQITIAVPPGAERGGDLIDAGNGTYGQLIIWDANIQILKGIFVSQPSRRRVWIGSDPEPMPPKDGQNPPDDTTPGTQPTTDGCFMVLMALLLKWFRTFFGI